MRFVSLFSGIEAASLAWAPLGWECVAVAEVEPFPREVLRVRHHAVPNLGDVRYINEDVIRALGRIDVVIGGFPCQDVSIAGKRRGFKNADGSATRSGLFWDAMRFVQRARQHCGCRWVVIENVPGLLNSHDGYDFAGVVGALCGTGFDVPRDGWRNSGCAVGPGGMVEWGLLDSQWWGLAQRRKRVFVVGDFGNWADRSPVLLERASMLGNPPAREAPGQSVTHPVAQSFGASGRGYSRGGETRGQDPVVAAPLGGTPLKHGWRGDLDQETFVAAYGGNRQTGELDVATARNAHPGGARYDFETETFVVPPLRASDRTAAADGNHTEADGLISMPLFAMALTRGAASAGKGGYAGRRQEDDVNLVSHALTGEGFDASEDGTGRGTPMVEIGAGVRRLTVTECERLMGVPDGYTQVPFRGKAAADGPRYRALGNSFAVPVIRWIGERIQLVSKGE